MAFWFIARPEIREATLDFRSSGQDLCRTRQLVSDGVVLANALSITSFQTDPTQVILCHACGVVGCEPGGWVAVRDAGSLILWIPAFANIDEDELENRPPSYFDSRGVPAFEVDGYRSVLDFYDADPRTPAPLTGPELSRLLAWVGADADVLGSLADASRVLLQRAPPTDGLALAHGLVASKAPS